MLGGMWDGSERQPDHDARSALRPVLSKDHATVLDDDPVGQGHAQTGPVLLGREIGFEEAPFGLLGKTRAGIGDLDLGQALRSTGPDPDEGFLSARET